MKGIGKIDKYCKEKGYQLHYSTSESRQHIGGASFYNDGWYLVDIYEFNMKDGIYKLEVKTTGRSLYWLSDKTRNIVVAFSQDMFLDNFKRNRDMYGNALN